MTRALAPVITVALTAAVLAALTGCTPGPLGSTPAPSASTPSAIVTGAAADTAPPQPALDVTCDDLASPAALGAAYGAVGVLHPIDPLVTQEFNSTNIPDADVLQTLGGISCDWSNGAPMVSDEEHPYVPVEVTLAVLPHAATQWARYDAAYGAGGEGVQCNDTGYALNCWGDQLVGTNWMELYMFGVGGEPEAHTLAAAIATAISSAAPGAGPWTPPSGTTTFGDCTQLLNPAQTAADLGVTSPGIQFTQPDGGWSIQAGARDSADANGCLLQLTGEDNTVGQINWLRGGAWAYDRALAAARSDWGAITAAPIAGLATGDRAQVRCTEATTSDEGSVTCTVDLELGGNWIQVIIDPYPGLLDLTDFRTATLAIATQLVAGYNAHAH